MSMHISCAFPLRGETTPENEGEPNLQAGTGSFLLPPHHALPLVRPAPSPGDGVHRRTIGRGHTVTSNNLPYLFPVRAFAVLPGMGTTRAAGA